MRRLESPVSPSVVASWARRPFSEFSSSSIILRWVTSLSTPTNFVFSSSLRSDASLKLISTQATEPSARAIRNATVLVESGLDSCGGGRENALFIVGVNEIEARLPDQVAAAQAEHRLDRGRDIQQRSAAIEQDHDIGDIVRQQPIARFALAKRAFGFQAEAKLRRQHRGQKNDHAQQHGADHRVGAQRLPPVRQQFALRSGQR